MANYREMKAKKVMNHGRIGWRLDMEKKWLVFLVCVAFTTLLSGCSGKGDNSGGESSFSSGTSLGALSDGAGAAGVTGEKAGGVAGEGASGVPNHNPEPVTMALFGSGLAAFAISRRKRRSA